MRPQTVSGDIIREYIKKFPNSSQRSLARKIYDENKKLFTNFEHAYVGMRYHIGSAGKRNRNPSQMGASKLTLNKFDLPESFKEDFAPHELKSKKTGILCDLHLPYHDIPALEAALEYFQKEEVDGILLNGDINDFHGLSKFLKDPRARDLADEIESTKSFLDSLKKHFKKARITYKLGNHDQRIENYLAGRAPELINMNEFKIDQILNLAERGIDYVTDKRVIHIGKLNVIHGHETPSGIGSPVNVARGLFLRATDSTMQGHLHRTSEHTTATIRNKTISTWSIGCLCDLHPQYMPINQWNHGFAFVEHDPSNGNFEVTNKKIINGKIY